MNIVNLDPALENTASDIEFTILMPCLNESETLAICIRKAKAFLKQENILGEILIADNGSIDGSPEIAKQEGARVIHVPTRGYGAALQHGIRTALGKYIIMGDADDSYNFLNLSDFVEKLRSGFDLVMGNRFKGKIESGAMPFLNKYLGNPVLSFLGRLFFQTSIHDFHCGLRGFNKDAILKLNLCSPGMEFASEMIIKASLQKLKMTETITTLSPDGRSRPPHLRPWKDGWRHLRLLLLFSPSWLFLYPGLFMLILGFLLIALLSFGPLKINQIILDIHTMLFSSFFIIAGLQSIIFFYFSRLLSFYNKLTTLPKILTLENLLIFGCIITTLGFLGSFYSFYLWMHQHFGNLIPTQMMRILIPSFTCLIAGLQIIFSGFFAGILQLNRVRSIIK